MERDHHLHALAAALSALTEWALLNTSPRDSNTPHELLIRAVLALSAARDAGVVPGLPND